MHTLHNLKFIKDVVKRQVVIDTNGGVLDDIEIVIKIKNLDNGKSRIHRLSSFLNQFRTNKPKYVSDIADDIVAFLNYIYFELSKNDLNSISNLSFDIGSHFLEQYSINKSSATIKRMDKNITKFYYFLAKNQLLNYICEKDFISTQNKKGKFLLQSPFEGSYKVYSSIPKDPIHNLPSELIFHFIISILDVAPHIALGFYFQLFGGLRVSEVISLEYNDISLKGTLGSQGVEVSLYPKDLRPDLKYGFIRKPKKNRKQTVMPICDLLQKLYIIHIQYYKATNSNALFLNTKGLPMTDNNYRYYFNKAKQYFINKLKTSNNIELKSYGVYLQNSTWSTHICRGIFSNLIADICDNIAELASWRGDSTYEAVLAYIINNTKIQNKLNEVLSLYYTPIMQSQINTYIRR